MFPSSIVLERNRLYKLFCERCFVIKPKQRTGLSDFAFQHKYQLNIDGTVAAYRFPYLLAGGSLVLKQDSNYYEHFYKYLKPYEHYVPFKRDLRDLLEKIQWAKENDKEVRRVERRSN